LYLGLDFGGTKLAVGLADERGHLLDFRRQPTDPATGGDGAVRAMQAMVAAFPPETVRNVAAVGVSFGGPVNPARWHALLSHHGPGWVDYPLVERIQAIWQRTVEMDNDANAAALG